MLRIPMSLLMAILSVQAAAAMTCKIRTAQEDLQRADFVFEGLPLTWDIEPNDSGSLLKERFRETKFLVKKRFKGQLSNEVIVKHPGPGTSGGIRFEIGNPVLVVAYQSGGKLFTNTCGGSESSNINGGKLEDFEEDLHKFKGTQRAPVYEFPG